MQLAKTLHKCYVVASGSAGSQSILKVRRVHCMEQQAWAVGNNHLLQKLGADESFDYATTEWVHKYAGSPFDAVVDPIGGETERNSYKVGAWSARMASCMVQSKTVTRGHRC